MIRSDLSYIAVIVVAFIAGYSVVSYLVRKLKEQKGPSHEERTDLKSSEPPPPYRFGDPDK